MKWLFKFLQPVLTVRHSSTWVEINEMTMSIDRSCSKDLQQIKSGNIKC